jgi:replication fork clamp-binding protein CrfC
MKFLKKSLEEKRLDNAIEQYRQQTEQYHRDITADLDTLKSTIKRDGIRMLAFIGFLTIVSAIAGYLFYAA